MLGDPEDVQPIVDEFNSDLERVAGEACMHLVELLKKRDARAKVKIHPVFQCATSFVCFPL
jgi:hypothetical protein